MRWSPGEFDLVGFAVGVAERDRLITGEHVQPGDVLIGLPSPGLRSNGYSLARRVLLERAARPLDGPAFEGAHHDLAEELLRPSVIYAPAVLAVERVVDVHAVAHITGGGIPATSRGCCPTTPTRWSIGRRGSRRGSSTRSSDSATIDDDEMEQVFNLGIGMVVVVPPTTRTAPSTCCAAKAMPPVRSASSSRAPVRCGCCPVVGRSQRPPWHERARPITCSPTA